MILIEESTNEYPSVEDNEDHAKVGVIKWISIDHISRTVIESKLFRTAIVIATSFPYNFFGQHRILSNI